MSLRWKTVRVFISSTFRDMHAERDQLVKVVFPALRESLLKDRIYLDDIDLRWGVTREQAEDDRVLELCLREIDGCRPFFIGILGERYGWVPLTLPADACQSFGWIQDHPGKSVTELEILHGVLNDRAMIDRAFFYLRDPAFIKDVQAERKQVFLEGPTAEELDELPADAAEACAENRRRQLRALKDTLLALRPGLFVFDNYPCSWDAAKSDPVTKQPGRLVELEAFGEKVRQQLESAIRTDPKLQAHLAARAAAPADPLGLEQEQDYHDRFMDSRLRVYVGRKDVRNDLARYADGDDEFPCLVTGGSGSGKSAALARFVRVYERARRSTLVISHFIGASPRSTNLRDMLRRFCLILKARFAFTEDVPEEAAKLSVTFREFVRKVPADARVLLVIDALNQLDEADRAHDLYWLPTDPPPQVKIIVSCISEVGTPASAGSSPAQSVLEAFHRRKHYPVELTALSDTEQRQIIRQVPSLSAKTLDDGQVSLLLSNPATANPLFLLVALEELRGFAPFDRLNDRIAAFPHEGDTVTAIFTQVIDRLARDFNTDLVETVLTLLASARRGLSERELLDLVEGPSVKIPDSKSDLFPVLRQLRPYLLSRAGLIDFYHRNLFKAVREHKRYLHTKEQQRAAHARLADYFQAQDYWLESLEEQQRRAKTLPPTPRPANLRKPDELPWHLARCGHWDRLAAVLSDPAFLSLSNSYEVLAYWTEVEEHSPLRMLGTYEQVTGIKSPSTAKPATLEVVETSRLPPDTRLRIADLLLARGHRALARLLYRDLLVGQSMFDKKVEADMWGRLATIEHAEGMLQEALASLQEQEFIVSTGWYDSEQLASCLTLKAGLLLTMGNSAEALIAACQAEKIAQDVPAISLLQQALARQSEILVRQGRFNEALTVVGKLRLLCEEQGHKTGLAECFAVEAQIAHERGQFSRAQMLMQQEETLWRQSGLNGGLARALVNQGLLCIKLGQVDDAIVKLEAAERLATDWNDQVSLVGCLGNLALAVKARGQMDRALALMEKQAALARQIGDSSQLAIALGNQANIHYDQGRFEQALALHQEKENLARQINEPMHLAFSLVNQGLLLTRDLKKPLEGLPKVQEAWQIVREHGFLDLQQRMEPTVQMIFDAAIQHAEELRQRGDSVASIKSAALWHRALEVLQAAVQLAKSIGSVPIVCKALGYQGDNLRRIGDADAALSRYLEAEQLARNANYPPGIENALMGRALVFAMMRGEPKKALPLVKEAEQICLQHNLSQELVFVREALRKLKAMLRK